MELGSRDGVSIVKGLIRLGLGFKDMHATSIQVPILYKFDVSLKEIK